MAIEDDAKTEDPHGRIATISGGSSPCIIAVLIGIGGPGGHTKTGTRFPSWAPALSRKPSSFSCPTCSASTAFLCPDRRFGPGRHLGLHHVHGGLPAAGGRLQRCPMTWCRTSSARKLNPRPPCWPPGARSSASPSWGIFLAWNPDSFRLPDRSPSHWAGFGPASRPRWSSSPVLGSGPTSRAPSTGMVAGGAMVLHLGSTWWPHGRRLGHL